MTWLPSVNGLPIDLVAPRAVEVDFAEIAHALAHVNRFAGNAREPVSVGLHTLIGYDFVAPPLRAKWLLHDAHEARLGDTTAPAKEAAHAVAAELYGAGIADKIAEVRAELEARHDAAIHAAAGVVAPTAEERAALRVADLRALATERRDFTTRGPAPRPWAIDTLGILPGAKVWRWMPPVAVEARLVVLFRAELPALARGRRAS